MPLIAKANYALARGIIKSFTSLDRVKADQNGTFVSFGEIAVKNLPTFEKEA